jgi:hypothetical protein
LLIVFLIVVIIVLAALIFKDSSRLDNSSKELIEMQATIEKIIALESEIERMQRDTLKFISDYKNTGDEGLFSSIDIFELSEENKELLNKKINAEDDSSSKKILKQILAKSVSLTEKTDDLKESESQLPEPHIVEKGENHFLICLDYLEKEHGLAKEDAQKLIDKNKLSESIVPGFKVWNMYNGREFATFITRGNSSTSPEEARRSAKQKLIAEKNRAIKELNSLYYIIGTKKNLVKQDLLEGGFFKSYRLKKVPEKYFKYSIDLRTRNIINIYASYLKIDKIDSITLYPKFYKKGTDYKITLRKDKRKASVSILNRKGFKKGRVVIAVE